MDNQFLENQIQFHVLHSQHKFIQSNASQFSADQPVLSTLFYVFLISLFGVLSQYFVKSITTSSLFSRNYEQYGVWHRMLSWLGWNKEHCVNLQAKEIKHRNSNQTTWSFSDLTKSVLWYCNIHLDKMNIHSITESTNDVLDDPWYRCDEEEVKHNVKVYKRPTFRVDQRTKFLLKDDIYIRFCFSNEEDESMNDGKRQSISYKVCRIKITSTKHSAGYITDTLEDIHRKYLHELNTNMLKSQNIFTYKGDGHFVQEPFHTNKSWKTLFIEDKEVLRLNIQQMKNFDDPNHINKHAGLPDHFVIMADGPPGTGKNSLFKALMKEEFADRQLIIIPASTIKSPQEIVEIVRSDYLNNIFCPCNKRVYQFDEIEKCFPELCRVAPMSVHQRAEKSYKNIKGPEPPSFEDYVKTMMQEEEQKRNVLRQIWENLLDGATEKKGMVMFMTSNNYDILDYIFKRPGRIHIRIQMQLASNKIAKDIIAHIFSYDYHDKEINTRLESIKDYTHSHSKIIQSCCQCILDFSNMKNNPEYICAALEKLGY